MGPDDRHESVVDHARSLPALFIGIRTLRFDDVAAIEKKNGTTEIDIVLGEVRISFGIVPFEAHGIQSQV
ncbi:MAG: hypothetical protein M9947_18480 [Thermomicrobiales bacterium]|nr:hypothetical protein [Thermomicrobiales bacterium]